MRRTRSPSCARATSGHAAAEQEIALMKSRRLMPPPAQDSGIVSVYIYDMGGELVKIVTKDEQVTAFTQWSGIWDGRNELGLEVRSGTYYAELLIRKNDGTIVGPESFIFAVIH